MSGETINVLLVEDNPGDARLFREALREDSGTQWNLTHCSTLELALEHLESEATHVIVLDLGLPDGLGLEVVRKTHEVAPQVPIVVVTSQDDEALGVQALHEGAQDYLPKGQLDGRLLVRALRYAMERQRQQEALRNESLIDELTGLYNRRGFLAVAGEHLKLSERTRSPMAVVFIDLDGMKQINDELGHAEGDRALIETAELLKRCVRRSDVLGRLGGDEFVLLQTAADGASEAALRRRLRRQLDAANAQAGRRFKLSLSVGVVTADPQISLTVEQLLMRADLLMYQEKQQKRQL